MYQIVLKGSIETNDPDNLLEKITDVLKTNNADLVGTFAVFQLAPYVDYQKIDDSDA